MERFNSPQLINESVMTFTGVFVMLQEYRSETVSILVAAGYRKSCTWRKTGSLPPTISELRMRGMSEPLQTEISKSFKTLQDNPTI
jgi:hypothetical protein